MRLTEFSQHNPAAVAAAAAIVMLFGVLALLRLPIQLLPDTRQPELFVNASWREAAPAELEEALIEPIEEAMRGLPGLVEMRSEANRGRGGVRLTFEVGTDMTRVMLDVVSRLNTLPPLPPDADEPQVFGGDNWQTENAASLLVRPVEGHSVPDIAVSYQQLMEEVVEPRLARVPGVSRVNLEGGRPREVHVVFDPHRLAALGITPQRLAQTVIAARDVSAGFANVGRRQFTVRVTGREPVADLGDLVVGWSEDRPLYLRDVADVRTEHVEARWFAYRSGVPSYYITLQRTSDSNTVELIDGVKEAIAELNAGPLAKEKLLVEMSWDASVYVRRAIGFVQESLAIGILLAVGGLWYFLRGPRALLVIGASIPISLFFAVITLHLLGRTLNIVSLAGLAFSTGIVVDAALIVQGNVLRLVQQGRDAWHATIEGDPRGHAGAARLDADQHRDLPADPVHGRPRGAAVQGPGDHDVGLARGVAAGRDDGDPGRKSLGARAPDAGGPARALVARDDRVRDAPHRPACGPARLDRRHHRRQRAARAAARAAGGLPAGRADRHDLEQHPPAARRQHRDGARARSRRSSSSGCGRTSKGRSNRPSSTTTSPPGAASAARPSSTRRTRATSRRWSGCCARRSSSAFPTRRCIRSAARCSTSTVTTRARSASTSRAPTWSR